MTPAISVVPANEASWEDLEAIFGTRGPASRCRCQRYKLRPRESFASSPVEERARRLREQTDCGHPGSDTTSGLVAYLDGEPAGWCAVEPRPAYDGLVRVYRVPWEGRTEDKADASVWAVTCLLTRAGYRKRGVSRALARAAVDFARERGARALEAYPVTTANVIAEELHPGTQGVFAGAGLAEIGRPTARRAVMRIDFRAAGDQRDSST
jgi:GNAT superfamily N-acetyltransferase